jgi:hypothetical protein
MKNVMKREDLVAMSCKSNRSGRMAALALAALIAASNRRSRWLKCERAVAPAHRYPEVSVRYWKSIGTVVALSLGLMLVTTTLRAIPVETESADALWVATDDGLFKLASGGGAVLAQSRRAGDVLRLAVDESRRTLWAY